MVFVDSALLTVLVAVGTVARLRVRLAGLEAVAVVALALSGRAAGLVGIGRRGTGEADGQDGENNKGETLHAVSFRGEGGHVSSVARLVNITTHHLFAC
jgi:hypothetical protein